MKRLFSVVLLLMLLMSCACAETTTVGGTIVILQGEAMKVIPTTIQEDVALAPVVQLLDALGVEYLIQDGVICIVQPAAVPADQSGVEPEAVFDVLQSLIPWIEVRFGMTESDFKALGLPENSEFTHDENGQLITHPVYHLGYEWIGRTLYEVKLGVDADARTLTEVTMVEVGSTTNEEADANFDYAVMFWSTYYGGIQFEEEDSALFEDGRYATGIADSVKIVVSKSGSEESGYSVWVYIRPIEQ